MPLDSQALRQQLREQFPAAHCSRKPPPAFSPSRKLPSFPRGAISELSPATPAASLSLLLAQLLDNATAGNETRQLALIDGNDSFDPSSYGPDACQRLLWIRCRQVTQCLRCADLLLRDGNLPFLILDLQLTPLPELRRIPSSSWYRLRNLAEQSGAALLIFSPCSFLPCAALQLVLSNAFSLEDLDRPREELSLTSRTPRETTAAGHR